MTPIVLCDVDGVIADFTQPILDFVNERCPDKEPATLEDVTQWSIRDALALTDAMWKSVVNDLIKVPGFCLGLNPYPGAIEGVKALAEVSDLYFVTSPWDSQTWCYERSQWLRKHFGYTLGSKLIQTSHKHLVQGDILIEDKPSTIAPWLRYDAVSWYGFRKAILWDRPYNQEWVKDHNRYRVSLWDTVMGVVNQ